MNIKLNGKYFSPLSVRRSSVGLSGGVSQNPTSTKTKKKAVSVIKTDNDVFILQRWKDTAQFCKLPFVGVPF